MVRGMPHNLYRMLDLDGGTTMNFFEKKLAKQFADHLVQKFANGETVKIPEVGNAIYDHEARIIRVDVTNKFASEIERKK